MEMLIQTDIEENQELVEKLKADFSITETKEVNIGSGADWWFVLITISSLFLAGKKINENLEAWLEISKKIKSLFKKKKELNIFIDKEVAVSLAISEISEKVNIKSIELVLDKELSEGGLEQMLLDRKKGEFISKPFNLYLLVFKVNNNDQFIFCIKSNGEIKFKEFFSDAWFDFNYNWNNLDEREDYYS